MDKLSYAQFSGKVDSDGSLLNLIVLGTAPFPVRPPPLTSVEAAEDIRIVVAVPGVATEHSDLVGLALATALEGVRV